MAVSAPPAPRPTSSVGEGPDRPGRFHGPAGPSFESKFQERLALEIKNLTVRYGGDADLARQIAQDRASRNFAASEPDWFSKTIREVYKPAATYISAGEREEFFRRMERRHTGGLGGDAGNGEKLGG